MQLDIDALTSYPGNPRRGNVDLIAESLQAHGQYRPVVVNKVDDAHVILAGNHTVEAARKIGWQQIDCHVIEVDADRARKINLIDNRANDIATYDDQLLADLLTEVDDLTGTGYAEDDLGDMIEPDPSPELGGDLEYRVVVDCRDEAHQADLLQRFEAEGLQCRSLIS